MLTKYKFRSKNFVSLMLLLCVVGIFNVYAQKERKRGNVLIPEDLVMVEMHRRNALLPPAKRRVLDQSITDLVKSMNGTWELVDRMVSNTRTEGKMVVVPTTGTMTFNLRADGTSASGDFLVMEEGLKSHFISEGSRTGETFALGSYNQVNFEAGFEGVPPTGLGININSFVSQSQDDNVVISQQIVGEIQGSYGIFRNPVIFKRTSEDLTKYTMTRSERGGNYFINKTPFLAPDGRSSESVDPYDIIKLTGNVMVLGISKDGIIDVWRKTSSSTQMQGQSLKSYWESVKASEQLLKPTFKKSQ